MAKTATPLTHTQIERASPKAKEYTLADGFRLLLRIKPNGRKFWLSNYQRPFSQRRNTLSLGLYPEVSLKTARVYRAEARALLAIGVDPQQHREQASAATLYIIGRMTLRAQHEDGSETSPAQYRVLRINSQQQWLCYHRFTGCAAIASSLMSVPHPGRSGIVNIPFSIKGKSVTKSSRQGTSSTSISMIRKLGMAAQR